MIRLAARCWAAIGGLVIGAAVIVAYCAIMVAIIWLCFSPR